MIENMAFHGFFAKTAIVGSVASAGQAGAPRQQMLKQTTAALSPAPDFCSSLVPRHWSLFLTGFLFRQLRHELSILVVGLKRFHR
jgi:hypothetical protein